MGGQPPFSISISAPSLSNGGGATTLTSAGRSPHPHLQIRHRGPDVAFGPFRDLAVMVLGAPHRRARKAAWVNAEKLKLKRGGAEVAEWSGGDSLDFQRDLI